MPLAGEIVRAADVAPDDWTAYTPAWTSTGTAPALGNGTLTGHWMQTNSLVHVRIVLTMGSTTTFGTGVYRISLPAALKSASHLTAIAQDSSAGNARTVGVVQIIAESATGDNMRICFGSASPGASSTHPFTWASGDVLQLNGSGEAA